MKTLRFACFLVFLASLSAFVAEQVGFDCTWLPFGEGTAQARTCAVANGDAQRVTDVATTNASGVVTSATGKFSCPGDAGKTVFLHKGVTNRLAVNTTTISVCTNATTVTLAANANATDTNVTMVWATGDSTSAITTQVNACKSDSASAYKYQNSGVFVGNVAGDVTLSGGYIVSGCIYDLNKTGQVPGIIGGGFDSTVLFLTPTVTACSGNGRLVNMVNGTRFKMQDITVEGGVLPQASSLALVSVAFADHADISNVNILNDNPTGLNSSTLKLNSILYSTVRNVQVGAGGATYLCDFSGGTGTELHNVFCSNGSNRNVIVRSPQRTPTSTPMIWQGGGSDECSDPTGWCTVVDTNSEFDALGLVLFAAVRLEAGALLYITDSNVGQFNSANRLAAADISATAKVFSQQTTWRGNVGGKIYNRGTFIDGLGNVYQTCTGTTCTEIKAAQAFTGNQPVTR